MSLNSFLLLLKSVIKKSLIFLIMAWHSNLYAQKSDYYIVDHRYINIDSFNTEVQKLMYYVGVPALSLAIIDNDKVVYSHAYGFKRLTEKRKVNDKTVFEACSLSKSFLVFVVHQLVDEGKLNLDKPMYEYLEYKPLEYDPRYKQITPRMILSHSSGIENWSWFNDPDKLEILFNPGEKYNYSGEGYQYLAKVVELILHQTYDEYINERIINPFKLKHTYLMYKQKKIKLFYKEKPFNYTIGHNSFGEELDKWKNMESIPASGMHLVAEDYAKLIISIFNKGLLSSQRIKDILQPIIPIREKDTTLFYGAGFEVLYNKKDTIIEQGGNNSGFKAMIFYSVVNKKGLVFFTNSDRGIAVANKLNELSTGLDISGFFKGEINEQYPSAAIDLLRIYRETNSHEMISEIEKFRENGKLSTNTLNELGDEFMEKDYDLSTNLLKMNIHLYPQSPTSYYLLSEVEMDNSQYENAYPNLLKAKELLHDSWNIENENDLVKCKEEFEKRSLICAAYIPLNKQDSVTIQAAKYCVMKGVKTSTTKDTDNRTSEYIGWIDSGDWMDYNIQVDDAGTYSIIAKVSSLKEIGQFKLQVDTSIITIDVPSTNAWDTYTTVKSKIFLPAGKKTLRLYATAGGFNIMWLKFSATQNKYPPIQVGN